MELRLSKVNNILKKMFLSYGTVYLMALILSKGKTQIVSSQK